MIYKSCHLLEYGLLFGLNNIGICCLTRNKPDRISKLIDNYHGEKVDWNKLIEIKNIFREQHRKGEIIPECKDCYNLEDMEWDNDNKIRNIYISHWRNCNCKCFYCCAEESRKAHKSHYSILPILKDMKEKDIIGPGGYITLVGGEATVLKEFDEILTFLYELQLKIIVVNSSGIKYSSKLAQGIKLGKVELTISIDSSDKDLYKKIKRIDAFDKVVKNIQKYAANQQERKDLVRIKYIILEGINDSTEEIEKWLQLCKKMQIKHVILDVENKWYRENHNNIPKHTKDLIKFTQERTKYYAMGLSYYGNVAQILSNDSQKLKAY